MFGLIVTLPNRSANWISLIAKFTCDLRHIKGSENAAADALSWVTVETISMAALSTSDFHALAQAQLNEMKLNQLQSGQTSPALPSSDATLICDTSTGMLLPYVPASFKRSVFDVLHKLSHPGIRATQKLIAA